MSAQSEIKACSPQRTSHRKPGAEFEYLIIGSGPAAIAALDALGKNRRIAVITGETRFRGRPAWLHPKIQAVSTERGEPPALADPVTQAGRSSKPLFSAAGVGGFANYWGQVAVRFGRADPWPRKVFRDYEDYLDECGRLERRFIITGGEPLATGLIPDQRYRASVPRLLIGTPGHPLAGLEAMRLTFHTVAQQAEARILHARAYRFSTRSSAWAVTLDNDCEIVAERLLLAAGVLGNAQLLLRSCPEIQAIRFSDHSPWMLYAIGLGKLLGLRQACEPEHFNAVTIEKIEGDCCLSFASVYNMRTVSLNLLLSFVLGRSWPALRQWPTPYGASLVTPIQIWTPSTVDTIEMSDGIATALPRAQDGQTRDSTFTALIEILRSAGARLLRIGQTRPGFGFHYHNLQLRSQRCAFRGVADWLQERTAGGVTCIDASALTMIGCRPPTLTAMATARRMATQLVG